MATYLALVFRDRISRVHNSMRKSRSVIKLTKRPYRLYFRGWNWIWFALSVRSKNCNLMQASNYFQQPVFVSGCQRSGTTLVTNLITASPDIARSHYGKDDELAGAYVLAGKRGPEQTGRYCFQTTYLNQCYTEYQSLRCDFCLLWVLRRPESVVYSMVYNWSRFPLNELFLSCGLQHLQDDDRERFRRRGIFGLSPLKRACYAYIGKCRQFLDLSRCLKGQRLISIDYDELVIDTQTVLSSLYRRLDIGSPATSDYDQLKSDTLMKSSELTSAEYSVIQFLCAEVYRECTSVRSHELHV